MKRYLQIWLAQMRYSLVRDMMFKGNFLLWIFVEISWLALQLSFVQVIFFKVNEVAGWTKWEMVMLVTTSQLIQVIYYALFIVNFMNFPELIRTGKLDFFLAQPASTQFLISTRVFDPGNVINALLSFSLVLYATLKVPAALSPLNIALYLVLLGVGVMVHYSLVLFLVSLTFWMKRSQGIMGTYYQVFQIIRVPREAFRGFFRILFTWFFPFLLIANVPAKAMFHVIEWKSILLLISSTLVMFLASSWFFNFGLKRYTSASS